MGYSTNPEIVERRKHLLHNLERGIEMRWVVEKDPMKTQRYAYDIREALYIASLYPKRFPKLAHAHKVFTISIVEAGWIQAKRKVERGDIEIHGLEVQGKPVPQVGLRSAAEVIEAWQKHLPSSDPLHFTQVQLTLADMVELHAWATGNQPHLVLLYHEENKTLTVTLPQEGVEEFAWHPPKVEEEVERLDL